MKETSPVIRSKPIADQALEILRERILEGVYAPDKRMPSEAQLSEELHISRSSLRTALASLAAKGYLRRRHGDGTYASSSPAFHITLSTGKDWDIDRQIRQSGRHPSMKILERKRRPTTQDEAAKLAPADGEGVFFIRRLFLADGIPVGIVSSCIAADGLAQNIRPADAGLPPHYFLELHHQRKPRDGKLRFLAVPADAALMELLQVRRGSPLLDIEGTYYDTTHRPLMLVREIYRGDEGFEIQTGLLGS